MDPQEWHEVCVKAAMLYAQLGTETREQAIAVATLLLECLRNPRPVPEEVSRLFAQKLRVIK